MEEYLYYTSVDYIIDKIEKKNNRKINVLQTYGNKIIYERERESNSFGYNNIAIETVIFKEILYSEIYKKYLDENHSAMASVLFDMDKVKIFLKIGF